MVNDPVSIKSCRFREGHAGLRITGLLPSKADVPPDERGLSALVGKVSKIVECTPHSMEFHRTGESSLTRRNKRRTDRAAS